MMPKLFWIIAAVGLLLAGNSPSHAQDPSKDDALDKLLEKIDKPKPSEEKAKSNDEAKKHETSKGELDAKDKDLDSLLEKLGETEDKAAPKAKPGADEGLAPVAPKPRQADTSGLKGETKDLDEHLEELTGRKKKKKDQAQKPQGSGPLGEAIKKMDEVEKRLSKTDTGEETRKTQDQIVKQLDQILEQIRQSSGMGQGRRIRRIQQAGNQPGDNPQGDQPGNTGSGVGPSKPLRPNVKSSLANSKDAWGDLPPHLREEMDNVFKEEMLPAKRRLIERYYSSLSKKSQARGE
jgi:hypothetical protein